MAGKTNKLIVPNQEILVDDMCICTGTIELGITDPKSKHVRQGEIRVRRFAGTPSVVGCVTSPDSNGTLFSLWSVKINILGDQTQVEFSAANVQIGEPSDFTYVCSYVVTGKIR